MPQLHISAAFDAGAIDVISLADPQDLQLNIRADNAAAIAQWFYFSLHGAADLPVRLRFLNAGQCAYPKGWEGYRVNASCDRQNWFRVDTQFDGQVMTVAFTPEKQVIYFAYFEPYSYERHLDLLGSAAASDHVESQHLGQTLEGRDMTLLKITSTAGDIPAKQRKKIWLIARQHPGEAMAEWFVEGFLERLLDSDDPVAKVLLQQCIFHVVPHMNPDGAVRGNLRTNAVGANLNREWAEPSLLRSPEVFWVRKKMLELGVDLCLDAHGDEGLPYNFVAGSEGVVGYSARVESLAQQFKSTWKSTCPDFQTEHGYGQSKPNSANLAFATAWIGKQFNCLTFTIEMPFKDNADLPDLLMGWSAERSKKLGASVLLPILAVVPQLR